MHTINSIGEFKSLKLSDEINLTNVVKNNQNTVVTILVL